MLVTRSCATFTHRTSKDSADKYQTHLPGENEMSAGSGAGNETSSLTAILVIAQALYLTFPDKCPGVRPIGIGEVARKIISKAVLSIMHVDI